MSKPTDAMPKYVRNLPAVIRQPNLVPEICHFSQDQRIVVRMDKQCRDKTYIVPALEYNIAVFTVIQLLYPLLYSLRRRGCRRKNCNDD